MPQVLVQDIVTFISKKWLVEIIEQLHQGSRKFTDLLDNIDGISNKVLSDRLKELYNYQLIGKNVYSLIPLNVKYDLSSKGLILYDLYKKIENYSVLLENE